MTPLMTIFDRLIQFCVNQSSPSKLEAEVLDAIECLDNINSALDVIGMDDELPQPRLWQKNYGVAHWKDLSGEDNGIPGK
jgi:hypothetical protein